MTDVIIKRSRGRPPAFDRESVVEKAMEVFWSGGYDAASIPSLSAAMGISAQSLYAAFGSKDALYREAIDHYQRTIGGFGERAMAEESDILAAMARLLRDAATVFTSSPTHPGCMITMAPSGHDEQGMAAFGRQLRAESMQRVIERLDRAVGEGQLDKGTDCRAWAQFITSIIQGLSTQALDGASREALLASATIASGALGALRRAA